MKISLKDSSAILPLKDVLPIDVQEKIESVYNYIENSILYPLRMVEDPEEADKEFEELYPEYERLRVTINTLLLDALSEKGYEKMEKGIRAELSNLPTRGLLAVNKREKILESFERARDINNLLYDAAVNTDNPGEGEDPLSSLPESRKRDFQGLTELIGRWELALTVASIAVIADQGEKSVIDHYIEMSSEFIAQASEKVQELIKRCAYCDKPFLIRRTNQKYCSKSCLNRARNERQRRGE